MSESTTAPMSSGVVSAISIVAGTRRVIVQVNGLWYDLPGISRADLLNDRRYAGRVTFAAIGSVSLEQAGAAPTGIDGSLAPTAGVDSTAPVRRIVTPEPGQVTNAPTSTTASMNAAVKAAQAVVSVLNAHQAAQTAAAAQTAPAQETAAAEPSPAA